MIKVFNATDKNYATHGDLILQPSKAVVHKEDNGEFYLDLETPLNEKEYKNTTPEEGQTAEGTSFSINVDTTKQYQVQTLKGQTNQTGTPTPSSPIPINITTGRQVVRVCGKNLFSGVFRQGTNSNLTTANRVYCDSNYYIEQGKTYTFSTNMDTSVYRFAINISATPFPSSTLTYDSGWKRQASFTFTASVSGYLGVPISRVNNANFTPSEIEDIKWQLEKGTSATTYEEYKGNDYEINLGKNLFKTPANVTSNGITLTNNTDGSITLNGTATANASFTSTTGLNIPTGTYTLSYTSNQTIANEKIQLATRTSGGTRQVWRWVNQTSGSSTSTTTGVIDYIQILVMSGTTLNNYNIKIQLEKGSQATSFTPYKTPIYLGKIGNYKDYIIKTSGKNLFDISNTTSGFYNTTTGELTSSSVWSQGDYIDVSSNSQYTLSSNYTTINNSFEITEFNSNKTWISSQQISLGDGYKTITTSSNTKYIKIGFRQDRISQIQFEEGSSATLFEPYGTGQWYIHKEIGKRVLKGNESNWMTQQQTGFYRYGLNQSDATFNSSLSNEIIVKSDYFRGITFNNRNSDLNETIYLVTNNAQHQFFINTKTYSTIDSFKTWLSTHNVEVYYVLNTPTNTLIEDEELINQLNSIELLEGLNNVSVSSANLPAILQLKYNFTTAYSNVIKYIDYLVPNNILVANTPQGDQAFRITNIEKTRRKIKLKANHVFYDSMNYLIADSYVVDKNCNDALDHLNNATSDLSPFTTISNITSINSYRCVRKSLYEAIQVVLERWGGHLVRNNWTLGIYDTIGQDNGVTIRYAKNLKDISATYDWQDVVTKLLPVGKDGILLNEIDPDASIYVESATQYDIPYTKTVSFEQNDIIEDNYKDEEGILDEDTYKQALVDDLHSQAMEYITNNYLPKVNYKLNANVEKVSDVGDRVEVIDEKLGINLMTNIISFEYDCILERYTQIEFGNFKPTLSNLMTQITVNTEEQITANNQTLQITLNQELETATDKIWDALGNSYVIYEGDKILVVDTLPKEAATNVIMINNGGIAFSNNGINGTFSSAWTIDNVFNAEQINVINFTADLVKGGTLKLGSNLNQNGQLEVYDETNALIAEFNKDGLKMYGADGSYVLMNNDVGFAGYDKNDNKIYWVDKDEFHMKKSVIEEEITLCNKMRYIPITIRDNNNNIINDGIGLVSVMGGE